EGELPWDKAKMLAHIDRFQALTPEERFHFILGRRACVYVSLDDLEYARKRAIVERASQRLSQEPDKVNNETIYTLMEGFM
ncbi:hypothetical protein ACFLW3_02280, partial [Chloroflexota bacterium]